MLRLLFFWTSQEICAVDFGEKRALQYIGFLEQTIFDKVHPGTFTLQVGGTFPNNGIYLTNKSLFYTLRAVYLQEFNTSCIFCISIECIL